MKIYTKTGDSGETSLFAGGRVSKTHVRLETNGTVDELNSVIGTARAHQPNAQTDVWLERVQNQLFHLGADISTPLDAKADWVVRVDPAAITWMEETIDQMSAELPELKNFILPGGSVAAAQIHVARTVCRRAERLAVALSNEVPIGENVVPYLNRLSDFLFTLARWENMKAGIPEEKWSVR